MYVIWKYIQFDQFKQITLKQSKTISPYFPYMLVQQLVHRPDNVPPTSLDYNMIQ